METPPKPPSPGSPLPSSSGASWHLVWVQRLLWLISALSGTLEIEHRTKEHEQRTKDLRKENDRLAELESKIDGLFSKYGMNSKTPQKPDQLN